jgi:hypothetical protein
VTRGRKIGLTLALLVPLSAALAFQLNRVPEPEYNGVKLGFYLTNKVVQWAQASETLSGLGPRAVPYLLDQMAPNPAYEWMFKIGPRLPASLQKLIPDQRKYNGRRHMAATFLSHLDQDAISALPHALAAIERKDPAVLESCMMIVGWLSPGTSYEPRAVDAFLAVAEDKSLSAPLAPQMRRAAIGWLQRMSPRHTQAIPAILRHMYEPGMGETCMKSLVRFGTNALPALRLAAEEEKKGHIRLAEMTIEKIEQQARAASPTNSTQSKPNERPKPSGPYFDPARLMGR